MKLNKGSKIVLFGASTLGEIAYETLKDSYNIICFCDNDSNKVGKIKNGKKIISLKELKKLSDVTVIISSSFAKEISRQLIQEDVTNFKVFKTFKETSKLIDVCLNRNISESLFLIDVVEGFLSVSEQLFLIHLPALLQNIAGDYVEIGSYKGKSATCVGLGNMLFNSRSKKIYCVDPFQSNTNVIYNNGYFDEFMRNISFATLEGDVIPIKKFSYEAKGDVPDKIAGLFIDGDHSFEGVKKDIEDFSPKVVEGGYIAFHDYGRFGVTQAVDEFIEQNKDFEYICDCNSIRLLKRKYIS